MLVRKFVELGLVVQKKFLEVLVEEFLNRYKLCGYRQVVNWMCLIVLFGEVKSKLVLYNCKVIEEFSKISFELFYRNNLLKQFFKKIFKVFLKSCIFINFYGLKNNIDQKKMIINDFELRNSL